MKNYFSGNLAREELHNCRNQAGETFRDHWKNIYPWGNSDEESRIWPISKGLFRNQNVRYKILKSTRLSFLDCISACMVDWKHSEAEKY